jgi:hypothetical protein
LFVLKGVLCPIQTLKILSDIVHFVTVNSERGNKINRVLDPYAGLKTALFFANQKDILITNFEADLQVGGVLTAQSYNSIHHILYLARAASFSARLRQMLC